MNATARSLEGSAVVVPAAENSTLRQVLLLAGLFALLKFALHLGANLWEAHIGWGYFRDEMYYILCGQHLDWGYVDHGPIVALQARLGIALFGNSLAGIRMLTALAGAADTLLTPLDAAERRHLVDLLAKVAAYWQQVSASQQNPGTSQTRPASPSSKAPRGQRTAVSTPAPQRLGRSNTNR